MKVHVEMTQEDLDLGEPQDAERCAIARAVHRATGNTLLLVGANWIQLRKRKGQTELIAELPPNALQLRKDFDFKRATQPINFDIEIPDHLVLQEAAS